MLTRPQALIAAALALALVASLGWGAVTQIQLAACKLAAAKTQLTLANQREALGSLRLQKQEAQGEKDDALDRLAIERDREREKVVKYVTQEVVRYVEGPRAKCVIPVRWVCIANAAAGDPRPCPAEAAGAADDRAGGNTATPAGGD